MVVLAHYYIDDTISKINVTIFGRSLTMSCSIFCLRALFVVTFTALHFTSPQFSTLSLHNLVVLVSGSRVLNGGFVVSK